MPKKEKELMKNETKKREDSSIKIPQNGLSSVTIFIGVILFIFAVVSTPVGRKLNFAFYTAIIIVFELICGINLITSIKKTLKLFPFIIAPISFIPFFIEGHSFFNHHIGILEIRITHEGLNTFLSLFMKSLLSLVALVSLSLKTNFQQILQALSRFKIPGELLASTGLMFRLISILTEEVSNLKRAIILRSPRGTGLKIAPKIGFIAGSLFIRTAERSEKITNAMILRGFNGKIVTLIDEKFELKDFLLIAFLAISLSIARFGV